MRPTSLIIANVLVVAACTKEAEPRDVAHSKADTAAQSDLSIPVPAVPQNSTWELDPENSSAQFVVKHVLSKVRGMFPLPGGTVVFDDAVAANSRVSASIDVAGISTGVEERDTHLKSGDFFDVARYPTITFDSRSVTRASATSYTVVGDLTMHGVTKSVTLAVTVSAPFNHAGSIRRGIEATTSVNRKDFELRWEYPGEGPGVVVGDIVQITINAELVLKE